VKFVRDFNEKICKEESTVLHRCRQNNVQLAVREIQCVGCRVDLLVGTWY
jgi:hypothetical protein